ncbi:steroid reductase [Bifidobacterium animalis subsp. lactis]|uniref:hypothetical protein n=1 Tax=Bifidobacterium animalis TaxID=28025 RepID=UPI001021E19C|nr:hypothetical protein [Bifidobacterium animalis]RYM93232.1 steroid reductase [Bifidobacterium animalis subsp. lactis]RYM93495.1 steroid reductase [Bifidobacterium animalis subsp. lactis]
MTFLIIFLVALAVSAVGFHRYIWFISIGYGFSIAAIGTALLIMFGGARRLELRQNKEYADDPQYRHYSEHTPILIPFIPLHSLSNAKWLIG